MESHCWEQPHSFVAKCLKLHSIRIYLNISGAELYTSDIHNKKCLECFVQTEIFRNFFCPRIVVINVLYIYVY